MLRGETKDHMHLMLLMMAKHQESHQHDSTKITFVLFF